MSIIVKPGDTLWSIAKNLYGDPNCWRQLYFKNRKTIENSQNIQGRRHLRGPDWIYPGTVLIV